ncbi:hypothetical protein FNV62_36480 [Streptomyces sp. RLB3-17]|uniref:hypothetical protein n=1 Tax=Streptomyces sp. RLB3-17 TaxID=2594455 RepID=UPI00116539F7|nr:hypothetical protein [Streptomyces sp. RLB3-17]QDO42908.1 hypothetical protein FNV62_36480 [Streptomyces sp. RLB3-17]
MDPAVIAALVSAPTAVLAAAAAYAAGKAQGRASLDAVRRQAQRDAYAQFLEAAYAFSTSSRWPSCVARVERELTESGTSSDAEGIYRRAAELRVGVSIGPLHLASIVVGLEGPEQVAAVASELVRRAHAVHDDATVIGTGNAEELAQMNLGAFGSREADTRVIRAMAIFSNVARRHLNGDPLPRDVWAAERDLTDSDEAVNPLFQPYLGRSAP